MPARQPARPPWYLPLLEVPSHISGSYDIESTHDSLIYILHEMHSMMLSFYNQRLSSGVCSSSSTTRVDRIGMVLGGAFTLVHTNYNLHFVHMENVRYLI